MAPGVPGVSQYMEEPPFFSIAMGADYSFYVKSIATYIMVLLGLLGDVHKGNFTWNLKALMSSRVC